MRYILILFAFVFIGCASHDKQHYKAQKFYNENKPLLADICALNFPNNPIYIPGKEIVKYDTVNKDVFVEVDCDTVKGKVAVKEVIKYLNKTITKTDTIKTPDLAEEGRLRTQINKLEANNILLTKEKESTLKELKESEKEISSLKWQRMGLIMLCFILGVIIFKK